MFCERRIRPFNTYGYHLKISLLSIRINIIHFQLELYARTLRGAMGVSRVPVLYVYMLSITASWLVCLVEHTKTVLLNEHEVILPISVLILVLL